MELYGVTRGYEVTHSWYCCTSWLYLDQRLSVFLSVFFTVTKYCDDSPGCLLMNLGRILVLCDSCWLKIRCFWSYLCIACMYVRACMESLLFHTMGLADALYECFLFFFFLPLPYLMLAFVLINLLKLPFTWTLYLLWMFMSHRILGCYREDCTGRCQVLLETCTFYYAAFFL